MRKRAYKMCNRLHFQQNGLQLECKRGPFFIKCSFFLFVNFAHKVCEFCNLLCISNIIQNA